MDTRNDMGNDNNIDTPNKNVGLEVTPKRKTRLTLRQEGFVKDYLETKNATEAIVRNYNVKDRLVAKAMGAENLAKPSLQEAITGLKQQFVDDSSIVYAIQKEILNKAKDHSKHWELANKISNKILDRAGFAPTYKSESKSMHAKFVITRGQDNNPTLSSPESVSPHSEEI